MTTAKPKPMAGPTDSADDLIAELARLMAEDAQSDKPKAEGQPVRIPGEPAAQPAPLSQPGQRLGSAGPENPAPKVMVETPGAPIRIPGQPFTPPAQPRTAQPVAQPLPRVDVARAAPSVDPRLAHPDAADPRSRPGPVPEVRHQAETRTAPDGRTAPSVQAAPEARQAPQPGVSPRREPGFEPVAPSPAPLREEPIAVRAEPVAPVVAPSVAEPSLPDLDQDSLADLIAAEFATETNAPEAEPNETPGPVDEQADAFTHKSSDVFAIPPVFGVGSGQPVEQKKPQPEPVQQPAPEAVVAAPVTQQEPEVPVSRRSEPDPLEEIERLIGPAVRPETRQQAPSAALRSLATPTLPPQPAPQPISEKPRVPKVSSVDEAILAAAATSGARVEWVEPQIPARVGDVDGEGEVAPRARRNRVLGMTRSLAGPLVATLLLGVAAIGLYAVLGLGSGTTDGPAPLIVADTAPIKEEPVPDPEAEEQSQSVVFNEIAGVDSGANEQLVSRDQADPDAVNNFVPPTTSEEGLVNRKVRTVTVRPDGTIVSGGDSVAGATMLPVDRPSVPDVPGADFSTPELIGSVDPSATAAENAAAEAAQAAPPVVPVQPGTTVPAVDAAGNPIAGKTAPVPLVRPTNFARQAAVTPPATTPAATTPVAAPVAATPTPAPSAVSAPVSSAPAYVQLASQRSEEAARETAQSIASRFGPIFNGANLEVQRVDLGERGIFYRVRVPADSLQSANSLCNNIKAAGGDCFTM